MCGIAGNTTKKEVEKQLELMKHRGPDYSNINRVCDGYWLGCNRLSINDLSNENRNPYTYKGRTIVLNGEIYNYKEIAEDLTKKGWNIETGCDAEVVLKAILYWGVSAIDLFDGMFAFAIYNKEKLILARDRFGEKPLYIRLENGELAFASEAKALVNSNSKLKRHQVYEVFQHVIGPDTLYSNIYEFPKACYAVVDLKSPRIRSVRYWKPKQRYINEKTAKEELDSLLERAFEMVLPKEVKSLLYLSKGIDSNLLNTYNKNRIPTLEIESCDFNKKDFENNIDKIVKQLDFPVGSFSSYALYLLSKKAKDLHCKVVISGEGADEIFAGYIRYLPVASRYLLNESFPSYKELFDKSFEFNLINTYAKTIFRGYDFDFIVSLIRPYFRSYNPIMAMQMFDIDYILPSLLQMGDRMAMLNSIENRCPYLTKNVVEFGLSLPVNLILSSLNTKLLNRDLLCHKNPYITVEKEKKGLTIPYNKWYGIEGWNRHHYFNKLNTIWTNQNLHQL